MFDVCVCMFCFRVCVRISFVDRLEKGFTYEKTFDLDHVALFPQKRGYLLGTGTWRRGQGEGKGGGEGERMKARPRITSEKDRRDRGPPPEQWN